MTQNASPQDRSPDNHEDTELKDYIHLVESLNHLSGDDRRLAYHDVKRRLLALFSTPDDGLRHARIQALGEFQSQKLEALLTQLEREFPGFGRVFAEHITPERWAIIAGPSALSDPERVSALNAEIRDAVRRVMALREGIYDAKLKKLLRVGHFDMERLHAVDLLARFAGKDYSLSEALIDIDNFKAINDTYGHVAGDQVLEQMQNLILQIKRDTDFAGRRGGEELSLLMPETDEDRAFLAAERLRKTIENHKFLITDNEGNRHELSITVSIGVATVNSRDFPHRQTDSFHRGMIESAKEKSIAILKNGSDEAMYVAKKYPQAAYLDEDGKVEENTRNLSPKNCVIRFSQIDKDSSRQAMIPFKISNGRKER